MKGQVTYINNNYSRKLEGTTYCFVEYIQSITSMIKIVTQMVIGLKNGLKAANEGHARCGKPIDISISFEYSIIVY